MAQQQQRRKTRGSNQESPGLSISVNGKTYTVRQSDVSAHDIRALRQETGFSWAGILREAGKDFDIDLFAAMVWFARYIDGEKTLSYDTILDEIDYDGDLNIEVEDKRTVDAAADVEAPEA